MKGMRKMKKVNPKKSIKYILLFTIMLFGLISCDFLANKTIHVPKAIIQERTEKKFPITKNLPFFIYIFFTFTLDFLPFDFLFLSSSPYL